MDTILTLDAVGTSCPDTTAETADRDRACRIRAAVRARSAELRARHPLLRHQDALGAGALACSTLGVLAVAGGYISGAVAWWAAVPLAAMCMAVAHEIEHDTIHRLYFPRRAAVQHAMLATCWLLRPYTVSPWVRRPLHLLHHRASGTVDDLEERAINNGVPWGPRRVLLMLDPLLGAAWQLRGDPRAHRMLPRPQALAYAPLAFVAIGVWGLFLGAHTAELIVGAPLLTTGLPHTVLGIVDFLIVVWIAPNLLRVACLQFISSNLHYFGDVEAGNVLRQTQVLNRWYLAPLQLFCANFGSTHSIHHFVPSDPFYVRQLTAPAAHRVMRENGVRFNDLGTFRRANRWEKNL